MKSFFITCTLVVSATTGAFANPINIGEGTEVERASFLAKRQIECPIGLDCTFAPNCPIYDCAKHPSLQGCGGSVDLRSLPIKHATPTEQSCGLVCTNDRCLYVPEPENEKRTASTSTIHPCPLACDESGCHCISDKEKRTASTSTIHPCPLICNPDGCICASTSLAHTAIVRPCPFICNATECVCIGSNTTTSNPEKEKRTPSTGIIHPCPFICDQAANCICTPTPPTTTEISPRAASPSPEEGRIRPCPQICTASGCLCATTNMEKREEGYRGPPCPSGNLICNRSGCICGGSFHVPVGPPRALF